MRMDVTPLDLYLLRCARAGTDARGAMVPFSASSRRALGRLAGLGYVDPVPAAAGAPATATGFRLTEAGARRLADYEGTGARDQPSTFQCARLGTGSRLPAGGTTNRR